MLNTLSWDPIWENIFINQNWGQYPAESLIQFIAFNFYKFNRNDVKLLEIGCGPGANIWYMAREGFDVYGIDGSKTAIEIANKRLCIEKLNASLIVGDIVNLPFTDEFFNCVVDIECLYANTECNSEFILKEIARVLKPEGLFYSRTFSHKMYVGERQKKISKFEFTDISDGPLAGKGFVRLIDKEGIIKLYGKYFQIESIDRLDYTRHNNLFNISEWIIVAKNK